MKHQQTISTPVELQGRGLFTGQPATLRLRPAEAHAGITFIRTDQTPPVRIAALVDNVSKRARRTSLRNGTVSIETIEHCLGACAGRGIDHLEIELVGDELPAGDASGLLFWEKLQEAGLVEQDAVRTPYVVTDIVRVVDGDSELIALPPLSDESETLEIFYDLDYGDESVIGRQVYAFTLNPERFEKDIVSARTFVLESEAQALLESGLGGHLTYQDILVFGPDGPIENELRFPDECVRHKILDLLGDLMLMGKYIVGRMHARKSGHALNHELVRALQEQMEANRRREFLIQPPALDIRQVQRILPHRYPLLMLDRIIELEGTERAVAIKNVSINEEFFQGHYPGEPIMPGVLIIEAMAQLGGVLLRQKLEHKGKVAVLLSLDRVKFRRAVVPGDQLIIEAVTVRVTSRMGHVRCVARVGGVTAAEAEIKFIMTDTPSALSEGGSPKP